MPNVAMMLMTVMLMLMMFHANADDDTDDHDGNSENNDDENDYKGKEKKNSCRPMSASNCRKCHAGAAPVPHMRMCNGNLIFCTIRQCEYSGSCVRNVATILSIGADAHKGHQLSAPTPGQFHCSHPSEQRKDPSTTDLYPDDLSCFLVCTGSMWLNCWRAKS